MQVKCYDRTKQRGCLEHLFWGLLQAIEEDQMKIAFQEEKRQIICRILL